MTVEDGFAVGSLGAGIGRHRVSPQSSAMKVRNVERSQLGWAAVADKPSIGELDSKSVTAQLRSAAENVSTYRQVVEDVNGQLASMQEQLAAEKRKNDQLREECKKDKQVLLDIAAYFKDGGLSRSEGQVAGHVSALRQSGQSEVAELLEGLLRRERILAAALQAATGASFTLATPLKLPAPPQVTQVTVKEKPLASYHRSTSAPSCMLDDVVNESESLPSNFKEVEVDDYWWSSAGQKNERADSKGGHYSSSDAECSKSQNRIAESPGIFRRATHRMAKRMGMVGSRAVYQGVPKEAKMYGTGNGRVPNTKFSN